MGSRIECECGMAFEVDGDPAGCRFNCPGCGRALPLQEEPEVVLPVQADEAEESLAPAAMSSPRGFSWLAPALGAAAMMVAILGALVWAISSGDGRSTSVPPASPAVAGRDPAGPPADRAASPTTQGGPARPPSGTAPPAVMERGKPAVGGPASMTPEQLFAATSPAVVRVENYDATGALAVTGSGFFVAGKELVSNFHVLKNAKSASVVLSDGSKLPVSAILATDRDWDVAVLRVAGQDHAFLRFAEGAPPQIGARVYAIGSPGGLTNSFSDGLISALRKDASGSGPPIIQTTVSIGPGSSGGPLLSASGQVIGIMTAYLEGGQNVNFAIPAEKVREIITQGQRNRPTSVAEGAR